MHPAISGISCCKGWLFRSLSLVALGLLFQTPVWAEGNEAPFRIATVDVTVLIKNSPQSKAASEKLKADHLPKEQQLNAEHALIEQQTEALNTQVEAGTISPADKLRMERDLRSSERAYNRKMEDLRDEVRAARDAAMENIQNLIFQAIEEVREKEQIDLVLKEGDYIAASKRVDMTDKVLKNLEQKAQADKPPPTDGQK
jgi:outer membrane protein